MGKLHELLAVEQELKGAREKALSDIQQMFEHQPQVFQGNIKTLNMFDEARQPEEAAGTERVEVMTTVPFVLSQAFAAVEAFWDGRLQKEATNQLSNADIIVDGDTLVENVPVTFLLSLEDELKAIRRVLESVPVLPGSVVWERDEQKGEGFWRTADPVVRNKTEQTVRHKVLVPAKDNGGHPAQVQVWNEQVPVGKYTSIQWSGMIPEKDKRTMLVKVSVLLRAVKQARQRANCQPVENRQIGKTLLQYIVS